MSDYNNGYVPPARSTAELPLYMQYGPQSQPTNALAAPYMPAQLSDNLPPMLLDAYRAVGVPDNAAGPMAEKLTNFLRWTPPVAYMDSASSIGNDFRNGNVRGALGQLGVLNALGVGGYAASKAARAFIPTQGARDAWQATYRETLPGQSATPFGYMPVHPTNGNASLSREAARLNYVQPSASVAPPVSPNAPGMQQGLFREMADPLNQADLWWRTEGRHLYPSNRP